jgi:tetratricopeptide (TPR) repeat protein
VTKRRLASGLLVVLAACGGGAATQTATGPVPLPPATALPCRLPASPASDPEGVDDYVQCRDAERRARLPFADAGAALSSSGDGASPAASPLDVPLPPPRPVTIPLVSGKDDKCDHELALGDAAFEKDDLDAAKAHYGAAAALDAKRPGVIVGLARVRIAKLGLPMDYGAGQGNAELVAAGRELRRATQLDPKFGPAHVELGRALLLAGDAEGALLALSRGAELLPDQAEAHSALGVARLATGHADDAVASLARAAELDPGRAERHGNYGTALLMRGRVPDAVREYEIQVRLAPNDARAHADLGTALLAQNQLERGVAELQRAVAADPKRATYHSNLGYALQLQGKTDAAIAAYRKAIELDDKLASAWINLATALAKTPSRRAEARAALEHARAIDPQDPRVKANLEELDALERGKKLP